MLEIQPIDIIGYIAGIFIMIAQIPQLITLVKTKDTSGVSVQTFMLIAAGSITWVVYGVLLKNSPIILTNLVALLVSASNVALTLKYRSNKTA